MDASTQQNAALVEESAAATRAMQEQSLKLQDLVSVFQAEASSPARQLALTAA
jgi:methyl-accepting chemotaxis protein